MIKRSQQLGFIFLLFVSSYGLADEVTDAVDEGLSHYKAGNLSAAVSQFDYAATLIRQQKASNVVAVFPAPLSGWQADDAKSNSAGGMIMGGGISASRSYYQDAGKSVNIELVMDSPMLQSIMMLINNPSMIVMSGGKLIKIQGYKAMLKGEAGNIEISLVVNNNALFTLRGDNIDEATLRAYAEALKLNALN